MLSVRSIGDVNGDGDDDVLAAVGDLGNEVVCLDGGTASPSGNVLWTYPADDGHQDVIAGSFNYHVYALNGVDGEVLWSYDTGNRVFSVHPVGDLNGDGRPEVVAGTQDTTSSVVVYVLDGGVEAPLFADDFESGDTGSWSATVP